MSFERKVALAIMTLDLSPNFIQTSDDAKIWNALNTIIKNLSRKSYVIPVGR
jgi:hypothetical protein